MSSLCLPLPFCLGEKAGAGKNASHASSSFHSQKQPQVDAFVNTGEEVKMLKFCNCLKVELNFCIRESDSLGAFGASPSSE